MVTQNVKCRRCGSVDIVKNVSNGLGNPKYKRKSCGFGGVFKSKRKS